MSFQAPYSITGMRELQMAEAMQQQQMQQDYMGQIFGALGDIAEIYQKNEEMEAGVKAGEMFGKTFGKQFGLDPKIFSSPEYKNLPTAAKYELHQGIRSNFGSLSQGYNFGQRLGVQQAGQQITAGAPIVRQQITNATTRAEEGDYFDATSLR